MKEFMVSFTVGMTTVILLACCIGAPAAAAEPAAPAGAALSGQAGGGMTGKVVETINSGGYTYVQVDDGAKKIWAAAPEFKVAVGDKVVVPDGMAMRGFHSKTLNRDFDVVYFVGGVQVVGGTGAQAPVAAHGAMDGAPPAGDAGHGMPPHGAAAAVPAAVDLSNIKKATGGQTVAELFANKAALAGKDVAVRGRVVKFTPAVMGKNWMHLQDGSGATGTNDLTVSTSADAAVGNLVLVRGKLSADKDLGAGYRYEIIVEDASVAVE